MIRRNGNGSTKQENLVHPGTSPIVVTRRFVVSGRSDEDDLHIFLTDNEARAETMLDMMVKDLRDAKLARR